MHVTTLALGSRPRQRLPKVWAKNEAWEITFQASRNVGDCHGMNPTLPSELPLWELES